MDIVKEIFEALGGATSIARLTGTPVQTVHSWKAKSAIPPWRRPTLLAAANTNRASLSTAAVVYLGSADAPARIDAEA